MGAAERRSPFTWKGVLVGAAFSFFIGVGAPYGEIMLQGSYMALNSSSPAAVFSFFLITFFLFPDRGPDPPVGAAFPLTFLRACTSVFDL